MSKEEEKTTLEKVVVNIAKWGGLIGGFVFLLNGNIGGVVAGAALVWASTKV